MAVAWKFAGKRPFPFHDYYANKVSFSYPTSRDFPKPQPACGVRRPQLLLSKTAVHHPNHSPSLKAQRPARATTAKTCARTRSLCCELGRVLHGARWAEFAGLSKAFVGKHVAISARRHRSQRPSPARRGFCALCSASLTQRRKGRAQTCPCPKRLPTG